nr:MAG TPA: hypothetical protein [Caudoviricetes sp.]
MNIELNSMLSIPSLSNPFYRSTPNTFLMYLSLSS